MGASDPLLRGVRPHAALRAEVTPAGRGPGARSRAGTAESPTPQHMAMTWARHLKRVFDVEIEQCARCGGRLEVIASIEEPELIERILAHRRERDAEDASVSHSGRGRRRSRRCSDSGEPRRARLAPANAKDGAARRGWNRQSGSDGEQTPVAPRAREPNSRGIRAGGPLVRRRVTLGVDRTALYPSYPP